MLVVFVNERNEIKDVGFTEDENLTPIEIDNDSPLASWSIAKVCCHKVILHDGKYAGFTPYVDTKIIEHIERLGNKNTETEARVSAVEEAVDILVLESLGL